MFPYLSIFGYQVGTYMICTLVGILFATVYVGVATRKRTDLDSIQLVNVPVVAGLGALVGAHLLFGLTNWRTVWQGLQDSSTTFSSLLSALNFFLANFGGMVFYGGLIGGLIAGFLYGRHMKLDCIFYADIYTPAIPLFHVFGRIGCFFGGCCYGIENEWGFVYTNAPIAESNGVIRLPIQLIEAGGNLILFFVLHMLSKRKPPKGVIFSLYLILYPMMRFTTEFFRGDEIRGFFLWFSTSQWISMLLFLVGILLLIRSLRSERQTA